MKRMLPRLMPLCLVCAFLTSCLSPVTTVTDNIFAMDTYIYVQARGADSDVLDRVREAIYEEERTFSRTSALGEIYRLNESENGCAVTSGCAELLSTALEVSDATGGAFSPCMGALTDLWDIKAEHPRVPDEERIKQALAVCRTDWLTLDGNVVKKDDPALRVDLGGIAKGHAAQRVIGVLRENGVTDALVSFGGSIACIGNSESGDGWNIGIKNPFDTDELIGTVRFSDAYLAVSGTYERYFEQDGVRYHHIFDPATGCPADSDLESVAVLSKDGVVADALSTALFVLGKDESLALYEKRVYDFEAILIGKDGSITLTKGLSSSFVPNEKATKPKQ